MTRRQPTFNRVRCTAVLIDRFMPDFQVMSCHETLIAAPPDKVYAQLIKLDFGESWIIRWLLRLRGISLEAGTLEAIQRSMFTRLGERVGEELVFGIVGRFWTPGGGLQRISPPEFTAFDQPGYAKAAWNFSLSPDAADGTRLRTETRIYCTDPDSLRKFRRYWVFVRPFSGWIRLEALRLVKRNSESVDL